MANVIHTLMEKYKTMHAPAKASFWFLICSFLQRGISTITTPIFTRLLTSAEYGQFNVFNSWMGIVAIFVSLNLSGGVYVQGLIKFDKERNIFSSSLQGFTTALVGGWTAVYFLFRDFWNHLFSLTTVQMIAMLVLIWSSSAYNFWAAEQRTFYNYKALVIITLLVSIISPLLGIFCVIHAHDKVTARILVWALVDLIAYIGLFVVQMRRGKKFFSAKFWKYALVFNIPLIPHYLSQTVLNSADRIMIKNMVGSEAVGIYSLAYSISLIMTMFNTALMQTISPWIYQKIKDNKINDMASVAYPTLALIAAVNLILIAFAPEAVAVFAPKSYYEAIYVVPPVAMSVYFMYAYDLFAKFAFYYEKTTFIMIASVAGAVLNIILNYIFIGLCGYRAAGYTTLACYIIYCVGHYIFMNKICNQFCKGNQPYDIKRILAITILFMGAGFVLLFTYNNIIVRYGIVIAACIAAFIKKKELADVVKKILQVKNT